MPSTFMSLDARRVVLAETVSAASPREGNAHESEGAIFDACHRFIGAERQKVALLGSPDSDDLVIDLRLARLGMAQAAHLETMCSVRATTFRGHRARALAYCAWDGGDLAYRVAIGGTVDDLVLQSLIRDLAGRRSS